MKLNTIVQLPDGRIGTICYNNLDGHGGVFGKHVFDSYENLPDPEFMLRGIEMQGRVGCSESECVGNNYVTIELPEFEVE